MRRSDNSLKPSGEDAINLRSCRFFAHVGARCKFNIAHLVFFYRARGKLVGAGKVAKAGVIHVSSICQSVIITRELVAINLHLLKIRTISGRPGMEIISSMTSRLKLPAMINGIEFLGLYYIFEK